ncbi:cytochrome bc1 complex cytochrome b subunit, partial [Patulibacter sp. S7RM1-6]
MRRRRDPLERGPDAAAVRFVDERLGAARPIRKALRYVFPDHWSFLLGEAALYAFVMLVGTGVLMALLFQPSTAETVWHGPYAPLDGETVSHAYASALDLSFTVPGGLLLRQTHHWAALLFVGAIAMHLLRILLTGAFRKPREGNYLIGVTLLALALAEGYAGYSLVDDLLSGMGLAIGYSTVLSIPGLGGPLGALLWDGQFPGGEAFLPRLFFAHVFLLPALIAGLIGLHLLQIVRQHHTQFPGRHEREDNVVGTPLWPAYALRALGLMAAVFAILLLLGGLVQINPVWQWGPYEPWVGENGAQPDFYLGWLIGALRIVPSFDVTIGGRTLIPNPFFGGLLYPAVVFLLLWTFPAIDRLLFGGDRRPHHLLDRPRDNPRRTAFVCACTTFVAVILLFGASDRFFLAASVSYTAQTWIARGAAIVLPVVVFVVVARLCRELLAREAAARARAVGCGGADRD